MLEFIELQPRDRVLFLGIRDTAVILALVRRGTGILVAGIGSEDAVRAARRDARDLVNVMFTPGDPHEIPWRDEFFTKIVDPECEWPAPGRTLSEILRVLAPDGSAFIRENPLTMPAFTAASITCGSPAPGWLSIRKQARPGYSPGVSQ